MNRKKGASVRAWLVVDSTGQAHVLEASKHVIMKRTGLPGRDLRILDPVLSYPSTVLGRERAVVVNLEHLKAIITSQQVLFLNFTDPLVTPFIKKLQGIFRRRETALDSTQEANVDGNNGAWANLYKSEAPQPSGPINFPNKNGDVGENVNVLKRLPFEFVALEACLDAACTSLDNEARSLEEEAHPALDKLTSMICPLNLERVRQIKSRLVGIMGRVQKVRDELEHLLDDDDDMAEMYLTHKFQEQLENSSTSSVKDLDDDEEEEPVLPDVENRSAEEMMIEFDDIPKTNINHEYTIGESNSLRRYGHQTRNSTLATKNINVQELEMILEAYFIHIEGTLNKLSTLREYVDDTEDYINLMLNEKQNNLLQMGVVLTTATAVVSAFLALTGVFGMNINIELFKEPFAGMPEFMWTVAGGTIGCAFMYVAIIAWCKHKRLLE